MPSDDISSQLTANERKILPLLSKESESEKLADLSGLKEIEVQRALQWLSNKNLVELKKTEEELIFLDKNGKLAKKEGLPEKKFLKTLVSGKKNMKEMEKVLAKDEINVSIGLLKRSLSIDIKKTEKGLVFSITDDGKKYLEKETLEDKFLKLNFPLKKLAPEQKKVFDDFMKRKEFVKKDKKVMWEGIITDEGKKISLNLGKSEDFVEKLTSKMLKDGSWKNKTFRAYDVKSKVPKISRGKKHFVSEAVEYIKNIWLEMGFEEMRGNQVQSAFWDLDSLFVPQDHSAREEQDTFYISKKSKMPEKYFEKVKRVHENGGDTGSKGWQTPYSKDIAEETLLRTHTTVVSAQTLTKLKEEDLPKKFFIVGKVFRNETLDWKHLFEFNQVEGIVIDPDANFAQLKGYLKAFFFKMGYPDVRIRPAHFPYTEPSAEIEVFHPVKKEWIEMGGCGIFRPEVTKTLMGFECPVLAWGLGMERIIISYYELNDLRDIYGNDLEKLKKMKSFVKG